MSKKTNKIIPILSVDNRFLSNTTPAKARMMLKQQRASVFLNNPFMLIMNGEVGEDEMAPKKKTVKKARGSYKTFIQNFTTYFAEEKEVYVQNLGSTNISLEIRGSGETYFVTIARSRRPMNLTQYAPFDIIKQSVDFRKLVNRNPSILRLMEEDEYFEYYEKRADSNATDVETEMRLGADQHEILMGKKPVAGVSLQQEMKDKATEKEEALFNPKEPSPRVIGLCVQADKDNPASQRISAGDFIEELESLEETLAVEDYEFIQSKGVYASVKKFALGKVDALTASEDDDE